MKEDRAAERFRLGLMSGAPVLAILAGLSWAPVASAQTRPAADSDEIVVTAQKREEQLSDVPMSITAASAETLSDYGVQDVSQLAAVVPGFNYQLSTFGVPVYTLRGVGYYERSVGSSPAVSIYVDQVPLTYAVTTRGAMLDLERVEVLKGPQGTLFGQNATGGAINYIAARPTDEFSVGADLTFGSFGQMDASGFISGPLGDTLSARLAFAANTRDDWQQSYTRDEENGQRDFVNGRLLVDWRPTSNLSFEGSVSAWHDQSDTQAGQYLAFSPSRSCGGGGNPVTCAALNGNPQGYPVPNDDPRSADWDAGRDMALDDEFIQGALRADWDLSDTVTLTSITARTSFNQRMPVDPDGTDFKDYSNIIDADINTTFQELRLGGRYGDRMLWMVGVNYQDEEANERLNLDFKATNNSVGPFEYERAIFVNLQEGETWGAFGSLDYDLTDALTARASARYTTYERNFVGGMRDPGDGVFAAGFEFLSHTVLGGPVVVIPDGGYVTLLSVADPSPVTDGVHNSLEEDNVSYRVGLDWDVTPDVMLYGNIARGYKSGNFPTLPGVFSNQYQPVTQESIVAYEAGIKSAFADGRVRLNASVFYYDYEDKQILGTTLFPVFGPLPLMANVPSAHVQGIEVDLTLHPMDGLRLTAAATYIDSEIDEDPVDPRNPLGVPTSFVGESLPGAPDLQVVLGADYSFPLTGAMSGFVGANYNYRSDTNGALGNEPLHEVDGYGLLDLRAGVEAVDGQWRLSVWGRNVTDEYYWSNAARSIDTVTRYTGLPATYGVTLSVRTN